jgi:hypothetical protein
LVIGNEALLMRAVTPEDDIFRPLEYSCTPQALLDLLSGTMAVYCGLAVVCGAVRWKSAVGHRLFGMGDRTAMHLIDTTLTEPALPWKETEQGKHGALQESFAWETAEV